MSIEGQGHFFTIYFLGFVCFVLYKAKISGEPLQDHWSSGLLVADILDIVLSHTMTQVVAENQIRCLFCDNYRIMYISLVSKISCNYHQIYTYSWSPEFIQGAL